MTGMDWLPKHEASLSLTHNDHRDAYKTAEQWESDLDFDVSDWVSEDQRKKAFETDSVWYLHWYPDTPIGFCVVLAADLEAMAKYFREELPL